MELDQIRVLPTRSALVSVSNISNTTTGSGKLKVAKGDVGTFTFTATVPSSYKIKSITFSLNNTPDAFTCTVGGSLSGSGTSWTFAPTSNIPTSSVSFSLTAPSSKDIQITPTVTMTTEETITIEELKTFSLSGSVFSFTSSVNPTNINLTNKANAGASSDYINLSKSSNERSLTISANSGYNLKFVSFYYYDAASDPSATPSVTTYTSNTYTWIPSSTTTSVDFSFDASSAGIKIWKIYVGYEVAVSTKRIYLKNSMGWATAYVTRLGTSPNWDGTNGSGSNGKTTYAMTYDASMKLFYCDVPADADDTYLCFTKDEQLNYGNFYNTEAVYVDGNYVYEKVVWVSTDQTITKNGTKYYNYEDSGIKGIGLEDYSPDVYLVGSHNSWTKDASAKFTSVAGTLTHTVSLNANTHYSFKIIDNAWFGNNGGVVHSQSNWDFTQWEGNWNVVTGPAGTYTFTYNRTTNQVSVIYPTVSHPNAAYAYFEKPAGWGACRVYLYNSGGMVMWHGCPMTATTTICGTTYHYAAIVQGDYPNVIFNDDDAIQTADWLVSGSGGKHRTYGESNWQDFNTYTITFNANGGTGSMADIAGICPSGSQTLTANTFTNSGYDFVGWNTQADGNGTSYANEATISSITSNITLYAQWEPAAACYEFTPATSGSTPAVGNTINGTGFGGIMKVEDLGSGNLSYTANGLSFNSKSGVKTKVTLDNNMQVGTRISMTLVASGDKTRGLFLYTGDGSDKITAFTCWVENINDATNGAEATFSYDVVAGDGLDGTNTFQLWRNNTVALKSITVSSCGPARPNATVYNFQNGSFVDWGTCNGGSLTLDGSQSGVSYQLYKDGVASGDPKAGTGSSLSWPITESGTYTVKSVTDATYAETAMTGSAVVTLQDPMLFGPSSVLPGNSITLTHPGHTTSGSWDTSDADVATVSASGVVTGVADGTVTITFHGVGSCNATKVITVGIVDACDEIAAVYATSTSAFTAKVGSKETGNLKSGTGISIDGYKYAVGLQNDGFIKLLPKTGKTFEVGDSLIVVVYNPSADPAEVGFTMDEDSYSATGVAGHGLHYFRQLLTAANLSISYATGNVIIEHGEGDGYIVAAWVKHCEAPECTETTIDVSNANPTYTIGDAAFIEPTFTVKAEGVAFDPQPALTYSSSNPAVATVNATTGAVTFLGITGSVTITATYERTITYCSSIGSYTITVTCAGGESAPKIVADPSTSMSGCNSSITLYAKQQDGSAFDGGTYQWYRNGAAIAGATNSYYNVLERGDYTVVRTGNCTQPSTNHAVVSSPGELMVKTLTPFQYYHAGKNDYSAQMKDRHLFAVTSHKPYSMAATLGGSDVLARVSGALWLKQGEIVGTEQMPDTVMLDLNELSSGGFSAGNEIQFVCSAIDCDDSSEDDEITLYVIDDTPTLALICSGASGDGTRNKKNFVYNGDFLSGYNKADLCMQTGSTAFDKDTELPFYTYIKTRYRVTPVNGYAPFNKLNYEPFDLLLLTDYPKATINDLTRNKFDSMYVLVDYRPMLSFKTHMVAKTPSSWAAKGFTTAPVVPKAKPQTSMNIVCYSHPMFNALEIGHDGVYRDRDETDQVVYKMLSEGGYDNEKGIQGFEVGDAGNFVTIAFTHYDAKIGTPSSNEVSWNANSDDRKLVASCERQANIEARMILISVNADALCKMTTAGMVVVDSALQYLLITDSEKLADCSLIFNDNNGTGIWSDPLNWGPRYNQIPNADLGAHIIRPCTVDRADAVTLNVKIEETGNLTIPVGKALTVGSTIRRHVNRTQIPTTVNDISIAADANGSGTLIFNNNAGDTKASVQMYSKAQTDGSNTVANWKWQYIGTPFNDVTDATINYYQSWIYRWDGTGWDLVPKAGGLTPFTGYCITHPEANHTYNMTGTLATTATQYISVPAGGYMVVGNSWTAPIQIKNFEDGDLVNITDKSIYFFNTGSDPDGSGTINEDPSDAATRYAPATYISVPIHAATYVGDSIIPAMQGFYVYNSGGSAGTLHLDYNKLVRPKKSWQNILSGPMHAPRRIAAANDEPIVAKLWVCGTNYDDRLVVLEREDFTRTYDSGWDGEKWEGNAISPMLYALNENGGQEAVTATPDMDGTIIGFRAGEDDSYTFRFNYDGMAEPIYLLDTETGTYTRVLTGNTYTFSCADKDAHNRFLLTRSNGNQVPTGTEVTSESKDGAEPFKFIGNNKMFIFVRGVLYDATGKRVAERREAQ